MNQDSHPAQLLFSPLLESLFRHATDLIAVIDASGEILALNTSACLLFPDIPGTPQEADGVFPQVTQYLHPDDAARVKREFFAPEAPGSTGTFTPFRLSCVGGGIRWLEGTIVNLQHDNLVRGRLVIAQDITNRVTIERHARAFAAVTAALNGAQTTSNILQVILRQVVEGMGAATGNVFLFSNDHQSLELIRTTEDSAVLKEPNPQISLDALVPATEAVGLGNDVYLTGTEWDVRYPQLKPVIYRAAAALLLNTEGRTLGVMTLDFTENRSFSAEDRMTMRSLADLCAQTLARCLLHDRLQESERRYRKLTEYSADLTGLLTHTGVLQFLTDTSEQILGYPSVTLLGQSVYQFLHPEDVAALSTAMASMLNTPGQSIEFTFRFRHHDGHWVWIEANGTDHTQDPDLQGFLLHGRDVSQKVALQEDLRAREAEFHLLFNQNPFPMWVYNIQTLQAQDVNAAALTKYGYDRQDFLGMSLNRLIFPEHAELYQGHSQQLGEADIRAGRKRHMLKNGTPIDVIVHEHEMRLPRTPDGTRLVVIEDITQQLAAQRVIKASERNFRLIAENSRDMLVVVRTSGGQTYVSPAARELLGYAPEEFARADRFGMIHPEDQGAYRAAMSELDIGMRRQVDVEIRVLHAKGHYVWLDCRIQVQSDAVTGKITEYYSSSRDETERKEAQAQLLRQVSRYQQLLAMTEALEAQSEASALALEALERSVELTGQDCGVYVQVQGDTLTLLHAYRVPLALKTKLIASYPLLSALGRVEQVVKSGLPTFTRISHDDLPLSVAKELQAYASVATLPIMAAGQPVGIFFLLSSVEELGIEERRVLNATGKRVGVAMERAIHVSQLNTSREQTLRALGLVLEYRDYETSGHTDRVVRLSERLARALGMTETKLDALRWGAYLHDIGKVAVPDAVLLKPGKLDDAEWKAMKRHAEIGYELLKNIPSLPPATLAVVFHHHERWDGFGYPEGLSGLNIPVEARIFAIVDVFDALIDVRPYKRAWTRVEALREIERTAGSHFDPQIAEVFLGMMRGADSE